VAPQFLARFLLVRRQLGDGVRAADAGEAEAFCPCWSVSRMRMCSLASSASLVKAARPARRQGRLGAAQGLLLDSL
jgi:hypothetical protein